jgi:hypothetical protein
MPNEFTCPSCHVRLNVQNDASAALICPRCLNEVLYPRVVVNPDAGAPAPVTSVSAQRGRVVTSVESEVKRSSWSAYFIILVVAILGTVGWVQHIRVTNTAHTVGPVSVLFGLAFVLTILILYPIGRGRIRATAPKAGTAQGNTSPQALGIFLLLVVLAPVAFFIIFFTVCTAIMWGRLRLN